MKDGAIEKRTAYLSIGAIGVLLAASYLGAALQVPFGQLDQPGPGTFPVVVGVVLLIASILTMWEGWHAESRLRVDVPPSADLRRVGGAVALLFGFLIAMPILGYVISSGLFCILMMRILSNLNWARIVVYSLVMCGALYILFIQLLHVPMPRAAF